MPIAIIRHAERQDYSDPDWVQKAKRPWDTPLSPNGYGQAKVAGQAIKRYANLYGKWIETTEQSNVPQTIQAPVTRVYSSPLMRCVQTAAIVAKECGIDKICIELALVEGICEDWYRQWGIQGVSNGRWGGPDGWRTGQKFDEKKISQRRSKETSF